MTAPPDRIVAIEIAPRPAAPGNVFFDRESQVAIRDLIAENLFRPNGLDGPFRLRLSTADRNLVMEIADSAGAPLTRQVLSLVPLRRVVKDYFLVCDSYETALRQAPPARIEAVDMGRRGLHNEGAEILRDGLQGKIEIDFETARRLFTLVCSLHFRGKAAL